MKTFRPYLETIQVGSFLAGQRNLIDGYRYTHYFSPIDAPIVLAGFNANFETVNVRLQLTDTTEPHVWMQFYQTPLDAIAGAFDDAEPVLTLPAPYLIPPRRRIQVLIQNLSGVNLSNTQLTMVGVRVDDVPEGFCRVAA